MIKSSFQQYFFPLTLFLILVSVLFIGRSVVLNIANAEEIGLDESKSAPALMPVEPTGTQTQGNSACSGEILPIEDFYSYPTPISNGGTCKYKGGSQQKCYWAFNIACTVNGVRTVYGPVSPGIGCYSDWQAWADVACCKHIVNSPDFDSRGCYVTDLKNVDLCDVRCQRAGWGNKCEAFQDPRDGQRKVQCCLPH